MTDPVIAQIVSALTGLGTTLAVTWFQHMLRTRYRRSVPAGRQSDEPFEDET